MSTQAQQEGWLAGEATEQTETTAATPVNRSQVARSILSRKETSVWVLQLIIVCGMIYAFWKYIAVHPW